MNERPGKSTSNGTAIAASLPVVVRLLGLILILLLPASGGF